MPCPHRHLDAPSPWIERYLPLAPADGRVLDLAAGAGRHTRLARNLGYHVTAADIDTSALADLGADAAVEIVTVDLEGDPWPFPARVFAAVIVANYLHRPLLRSIIAAVAPGGLLIYETFARGNEAFGRPSNPDFLLVEGELLEAVRGRLTVLAYEHGRTETPRQAVIQRIAAVRRPDDAKIARLPITWEHAARPRDSQS